MTRKLCLEIADKVMDRLSSFCDKVEIAGSYRREKKEPGDVDIICLPFDIVSVKDALEQVAGNVLAMGEHKCSIMVDGEQVDVNFIYDAGQWGAFLLHHTGSKEFNIMLRNKAKREYGYKLNQYGLWDGDALIAGATEEEVLSRLGMAFVEPARRS